MKYYEISISAIHVNNLSLVDFVDQQGKYRHGLTAPLSQMTWLLKAHNFIKDVLA